MKPTTGKEQTALLVIDVQNDFMEGGALAITDASHILPVVNERIHSGDYSVIVATQDMHPADHESFKLWPPHCVENTRGAELHPGLSRDRINLIFRKGMNRNVDSYGAFYDNEGRSTHLVDFLKAAGITAVDVVGLATDYCVGTTALQAAQHFSTRVLLPGCRGVGIEPDAIPKMYARLEQAGVLLERGNGR
ncbi:MAG: nicotinamidase [Verrucomicrobiota bacterium]|nr:nicotinamidase [Verrucomicrobiota bacterium]